MRVSDKVLFTFCVTLALTILIAAVGVLTMEQALLLSLGVGAACAVTFPLLQFIEKRWPRE